MELPVRHLGTYIVQHWYGFRTGYQYSSFWRSTYSLLFGKLPSTVRIFDHAQCHDHFIFRQRANTNQLTHAASAGNDDIERARGPLTNRHCTLHMKIDERTYPRNL